MTQNCNAYDILLCQRFFRIMYYIQEYTYQNERNIKVILQSLIPSMDKEKLKSLLFMLLKSQQKVEEIYDLLSYNVKYKFDIQYTPFLEIGSKVIFPISVLACSNLMRNTIAYSYLSKNEIVEYSCAMKSHFRKFGNQMSGSGNHLCNYASLLA